MLPIVVKKSEKSLLKHDFWSGCRRHFVTIATIVASSTPNPPWPFEQNYKVKFGYELNLIKHVVFTKYIAVHVKMIKPEKAFFSDWFSSAIFGSSVNLNFFSHSAVYIYAWRERRYLERIFCIMEKRYETAS